MKTWDEARSVAPARRGVAVLEADDFGACGSEAVLNRHYCGEGWERNVVAKDASEAFQKSFEMLSYALAARCPMRKVSEPLKLSV